MLKIGDSNIEWVLPTPENRKWLLFNHNLGFSNAVTSLKDETLKTDGIRQIFKLFIGGYSVKQSDGEFNYQRELIVRQRNVHRRT